MLPSRQKKKRETPFPVGGAAKYKYRIFLPRLDPKKLWRF